MAALATARETLPLNSHRHSPKKFTQHQLFACLVLKYFLKTDYRGVVAHLADCPSLAEVLELSSVPHYTTLQKTARRLLAAAPARRLLDATVREQLGRKQRVSRTAIDSTGLESSAASGYFVRRRERRGTPWKSVLYHRFPKLGVVCDVETHFILASQESRGPQPDVAEFQPLLLEALARVRMDRIVADAGYDSEPNHFFARRTCGVHSIIPAKHGRPTTKPARGHYRRLMQTRFDQAAYRDRVQVETVISMVKRRLESCVRGRSARTQRYELRLKVLTHNVMILLRVEVFYTACHDTRYWMQTQSTIEDLWTKRPNRTERIVELHVRRDQKIEVSPAKDDKVMEALIFDRLDPAFHVHVLIGSVGRCGDDTHAGVSQNGIERSDEHAVSVASDMIDSQAGHPGLIKERFRLSLHPLGIGLKAAGRTVDAPGWNNLPMAVESLLKLPSTRVTIFLHPGSYRPTSNQVLR